MNYENLTIAFELNLRIKKLELLKDFLLHMENGQPFEVKIETHIFGTNEFKPFAVGDVNLSKMLRDKTNDIQMICIFIDELILRVKKEFELL